MVAVTTAMGVQFVMSFELFGKQLPPNPGINMPPGKFFFWFNFTIKQEKKKYKKIDTTKSETRLFWLIVGLIRGWE